jgi:hypothetical protein
MSTSNYQQGRLYKTEDYSMFDMHEHNRVIHEDPILLQSMMKNGFLPSSPAHVCQNGGDKFKVMRGHHRIHYAKRLKLPVYFIVDNSNVDIYELEGSTKVRWSGFDFLFSRARAGDEECKALLAYQKKNRLPLGSAADLFGGQTGGSMNKIRDIKRGTFQRGDQEHGNKVLSVLGSLDAFKLEFLRSSSFIKALSHALRVPELSFDHLLHKTQTYGSFLHKRATYQDYLEEIENLYNRGLLANKRLPIKLLANAVAQKRKESFGRKDN